MHRHAEVIVLVDGLPADDGGLPVMQVELVVDEAVQRPVRGVSGQLPSSLASSACLSLMAALMASRTGL